MQKTETKPPGQPEGDVTFDDVAFLFRKNKCFNGHNQEPAFKSRNFNGHLKK
jgi:hypothetical protein